MKKEEVGLITLRVSSDGQDAIQMMFYRNGTISRYGAGGLPQVGISGTSHTYHSKYFDQLIKKIPPLILDKTLNHEEETPNGYIEYLLIFSGVSKNDHDGEHAKWSKTTGVRLKLDKKSTFSLPVKDFLDGITIYAAELTNEWYYDVVMSMVYKAKSSALPEETKIFFTGNRDEIKNSFDNYINQMLQNSRNWDIRRFMENKTYMIKGHRCRGQIIITENSYTVRFLPVET